MSETAYYTGLDVVEKCKNNAFIGFVCPGEELETRQAAETTAASGDAPGTAGAGDQNGHGTTAQSQSAMADTSGKYIDDP